MAEPYARCQTMIDAYLRPGNIIQSCYDPSPSMHTVGTVVIIDACFQARTPTENGELPHVLSVFATACPSCVRSVTRMHISSRAVGLKILHRPVIRAHTTTTRGGASMSVSRYQLQRDTQLVIQKGDITEWEGDAVVNAGPQSHFCLC